MDQTVLILGGYGKAGSYITELLLTNTKTIKVIIAGRNLSKAKEVTDKLTNKYNGTRVSALKVDANNHQELKKVFRLCDLVIVSFPYKNGQGKIVIESAVSEGINYIDLNADTGKYQVLEEYSKVIEKKGLVFLTGAGIIPGCPAMLANYVGEYFDQIQKIKISSLYRDKNIPNGGVYDIISHAGKTAWIYKNKSWQKTSPFTMRKTYFGDRFKNKMSVPIYLSELKEIPEKFNLEELTAYQAGINPFVDTIYFIWKIFNLSHFKKCLNLGIDLFQWGNQKFTKSPYGLLLKIESIGEKEGSLEKMSVSLEHDDMYLATAIPVVAAVLQIFEKEIKKNGHDSMGDAVNTVDFIQKLKDLGMEVREVLS